MPKDGKPVKAVAGWKPKDGANEVKLNEHLGVIQFRGEGQPRGTLLVTGLRRPRSGGEGPRGRADGRRLAGGDGRRTGRYAVWLVPESGARARRVADKVRVHAGKTATAD